MRKIFTKLIVLKKFSENFTQKADKVKTSATLSKKGKSRIKTSSRKASLFEFYKILSINFVSDFCNKVFSVCLTRTENFLKFKLLRVLCTPFLSDPEKKTKIESYETFCIHIAWRKFGAFFFKLKNLLSYPINSSTQNKKERNISQ